MRNEAAASKVGHFFLVSLLVLLPGCKDNFDISFFGRALICIKIGAKKAESRADLEDQIKGLNVGGTNVQPGDIEIQRLPDEDRGGFNIWLLKIEFGGSSQAASLQAPLSEGQNKVHVGIELEDGAEWKRIETTTAEITDGSSSSQGVQTILPSPPQAQIIHDALLGRALLVFNPSLTTSNRLETFEVAQATVDIDLLELTYADPGVESLPWFTVISTSTFFDPGQARIFDIPDDPFLPSGVVYWRALYTDAAATLPPMGAVQSVPLAQSINTTYFPQFGGGGGLVSDIVLLNPASTGDPVQAAVVLLTPEGDPLDVGFEGSDGSALSIPATSAVTLRTNQTVELKIGSATVSSDGRLAGVVRFTTPGSGVAGVPESSVLTAGLVPVRNEGTIRTALAIRNAAPFEITVRIRVSLGQNQIETDALIEAGGRLARFVDELFPVLDGTEFSGTATLEVDAGSFAAIALEQGPGVFTTLPVTRLR